MALQLIPAFDHVDEKLETSVRPELSLILPTYNEEENIELVMEKVDNLVRKTGLSHELIVVNDGSVDDTSIKVGGYAKCNGHVKIISYRNNMGKGYALRTGFSLAKGDMVVLMDSDTDIDPYHITQYVNALKTADMVIASKWHPDSKVDAPPIRKILSHGFNILVKLLVGLRFSDTQTGLKAIRRSAFVDLFPKLIVKRYAFDVELLALVNLLDLKVAELPINLRLKSLFSFKEVWRMLWDLLGITYRLRVTRWYQRGISDRSTQRVLLTSTPPTRT